ncbi:hypothetical protein GCM10020000_05370 [Streptomyces olivoverticillatus]
MANPTPFVGFSRQRALALDGRCKPFSDDADGMTLAEGVGLVLLERLSDAQRNGHTVLAVVRGSAVNQDGASNGLTAPPTARPSSASSAKPSPTRGVSAADVDAVEAHGTGTKLGDPIEAQALLATYGQDREQPLWLGSLKSNIGHTQAAAGIAGVIKMVMAMREGTLPRTLHTSTPSSHVDWSAGAVELLTEQVQWPETGRPRRAGVSSFGISGTNAHLILEQGPGAAAEPEPQPEATADGRVVPWLLSAQSEAALRDQAARLLAHLDTHPDLDPARTGWSLATTRARLDHRAVLLGEDRDALRNALDALATARTAPAVVRGACGDAESGPVFVFPGQGAQWWGMGRELLATSEVFRDTVDACAQALAPHTDWSLHDVLADDADPALLERVDVVQPTLFSMMVALAALWRSYGVEPAAVVGHSQGEIAAACVAGALSLDDAAAVVALRSKALLALSGKGGMMSVAATVEQVTALLEPWADRLSLAAVNGPASVVVSGAPDALDALQEECERQGVRARRIAVDYASHGAQVEEIRDELARLLAAVKPQPPEVPFYSTVTGERLDAATALDAEYWYTNLRQTVRLEQATKALLADGHRIFAEVSPHPVLTAAVQETAEDTGNESAVALGSLRRDEGDLKRFLTSLAEAYVRGAPRRLAPGIPRAARRPPTAGTVELPTYAFQHRRYWPETGTAAESTGGGAETETDKAFWGLIESGDLDSLAERAGRRCAGRTLLPRSRPAHLVGLAHEVPPDLRRQRPALPHRLDPPHRTGQRRTNGGHGHLAGRRTGRRRARRVGELRTRRAGHGRRTGRGRSRRARRAAPDRRRRRECRLHGRALPARPGRRAPRRLRLRARRAGSDARPRAGAGRRGPSGTAVVHHPRRRLHRPRRPPHPPRPGDALGPGPGRRPRTARPLGRPRRPRRHGHRRRPVRGPPARRTGRTRRTRRRRPDRRPPLRPLRPPDAARGTPPPRHPREPLVDPRHGAHHRRHRRPRRTARPLAGRTRRPAPRPDQPPRPPRPPARTHSGPSSKACAERRMPASRSPSPPATPPTGKHCAPCWTACPPNSR